MGQSTIKFIIAEGLDVNFFSSKDGAERSMEAHDLEHTDYVGFDSEGRRLSFAPNAPLVTISIAEDQPDHAGQLVNLLREFLSAIGAPCDEQDLQVLLGKCEQFVDQGQ